MADNVIIVGTIKIGGAAPEQCVITGVSGDSGARPEHPIFYPPGSLPHPEHPIYLPPGSQPHPEHPIVLPPGDPPTAQPPEGVYPRWVYSVRYGWVIDPGEGGKPQPLPPTQPPASGPTPTPHGGDKRS